VLRVRGGRVVVDTQCSELGFDGSNNGRVEGVVLSDLLVTVMMVSVDGGSKI